MAKVDLGEKRTCPECEVKFYDLTRNPATCPKCGYSYDPTLVAATIVAEVIQPEPDTSADGKTAKAATDEDEEEIDEAEDEAKELELDGDNTSLMAGSDDGDDDVGDKPGRNPDLDGFSTSDEEEEDADAALVTDEDTLPTADDSDDDDDAEI